MNTIFCKGVTPDHFAPADVYEWVCAPAGFPPEPDVDSLVRVCRWALAHRRNQLSGPVEDAVERFLQGEDCMALLRIAKGVHNEFAAQVPGGWA